MIQLSIEFVDASGVVWRARACTESPDFLYVERRVPTSIKPDLVEVMAVPVSLLRPAMVASDRVICF